MKRDVLDMLWNAMDFVQIYRINQDKYLSVISAMPIENFKALMNNLADFSEQFFELLYEIDSHKEVLILRLKTMIDDKSKLIIEKAEESRENPESKPMKHDIMISITVHDNSIDLENLLILPIRW
jgi:hypothetical protein